MRSHTFSPRERSPTRRLHPPFFPSVLLHISFDPVPVIVLALQKQNKKNPHEVYANVFCCIYRFHSKVWPVHDLCMLWTKPWKPGKCCWKKHCLIASKYCVFCVSSRFLYFLCGISTLLRPLLHPINMWLSLLFCDYESLCVKGDQCCWPPALSPRQDCMSERVGVFNVKNFEMSWWFWLLRREACSWRTHMCPMSSKRCSSPQNGAFGKWCFDRFDVCLHSGTHADSCVRLVNSAALMSTERT